MEGTSGQRRRGRAVATSPGAMNDLADAIENWPDARGAAEAQAPRRRAGPRKCGVGRLCD